MNAQESLAADRVAERATQHSLEMCGGDSTFEYQSVAALVAIAAELRAARVYANYLEGRTSTWTSQKRSEAAGGE